MDSFIVVGGGQFHSIDRDLLSKRLSQFAESEVDDLRVTLCSDLSVMDVKEMSPWKRAVWQFTHRFDWLHSRIYSTNTAQAALSLELIEKQIALHPQTEGYFIELFRRAVERFNRSKVVKVPYEPMILSIHHAVAIRDLSTVIRLVTKKKRYLELCNCCGETPLHVSLRMGFREISRFLIVEQRHPRVLATAEVLEGNTPLHLAVAGGDREMVKLLLRHPIDPQRNLEGLTPWDIAKMTQNRELCGMLFEYSAKRYNHYF